MKKDIIFRIISVLLVKVIMKVRNSRPFKAILLDSPPPAQAVGIYGRNSSKGGHNKKDVAHVGGQIKQEH